MTGVFATFTAEFTLLITNLAVGDLNPSLAKLR